MGPPARSETCPAVLLSGLARQSCPAVLQLPGSLARQSCPAVLPGRLARQSCPAVLSGRLARQSCPAVLPGSLARQSCPAVLPGSLARQSCLAVFPGSLARQPFYLKRLLTHFSSTFDAPKLTIQYWPCISAIYAASFYERSNNPWSVIVLLRQYLKLNAREKDWWSVLKFHEAPHTVAHYMGCLMEFKESLTLFYTKMSFKILKFSNRPSVFFPSKLL
jgi:hypothetical protein